MKKAGTLTLLLAFALSLSIMISGCSNAPSTTPSASAPSETKQSTTTQTQTTPALEFSYMSWDGAPIASNTRIQDEIQKTLKEKLGYDVTINIIDVTFEGYQEKMALLINSNSSPDYFIGEGDMTKYIKQGVLSGAEISFFQKSMPDLYQYIDSLDVHQWAAQTYQDICYGVPYPWVQGNFPRGIGWRTDLLKKAGIEQIPTTIDEMETAFAAVKDKLGISGISAYGKDGNRNFNSIFGAYGLMPYNYTLRDNKVYFSAILPEAKLALTKLNDWYMKGYILADWDITDQTTAYNALLNGQVVVNDDIPWSRLYDGPDADTGNFPPLARAIDSNAVIEFGPAPKGPDGHYGQLAFGYFTAAHYFGSQVQDDMKRFEQICQVINLLSTNEDLFVLSEYGIEGKDFKMENDMFIRIGDSTSDQGRTQNGNTKYWRLFGVDNQDLVEKFTYSAGFRNYLDDFLSGVHVYTNVIETNWGSLGLPVEADADRVIFTNYVKFINGSRSLNEFDNFVQEWYAAGGTDIENEANRIFQEFQNQ